MIGEAPALRVGPALLAAGSAEGPLAGLTFVVKDLIDVAGIATGAGNPRWLHDARPAGVSAPVVEQLTRAGAACVGKAHTDELAYSLAGNNAHYGAPPNPAAPGRFAGGSSSGSASAVAAGMSDFALGTDTGGSIRVPASYCGIVGFRPSHGRITMRGIVPLGPSFDTAGILSRELSHAAAAAGCLLNRPDTQEQFDRVLVADAAFTASEPDVADAVLASARQIAAALGLPLEPADLAPGDLVDGAQAFIALQGREAWASHGAWITRVQPKLGPDIAARFAAAARVTDEAHERAQATRTRMRHNAGQVLRRSLLIVPTTPAPAPLLSEPDGDAAQVRRIAILQLTCLAGMIGAPALSLPVAEARGLPVGVCLIGAPGTDELLLRAAAVAESARRKAGRP